MINIFTIILLYLNNFISPMVSEIQIPNRYILNNEAEALMLSVTGKTISADQYKNIDPSKLKMMNPPMEFEKIKTASKIKTEIYKYSISKEGNEWQIIAVFNYEADPVILNINSDELFDIKTKQTQNQYLAYDVITNQIIGIFPDILKIKIKANSARLISIRIYDGSPLMISVGSHIGQGYYELNSQRWDNEISTMSVSMNNFDGRDIPIRLLVPEGWKLRFLAINGRSSNWEEYRGNIFRFNIPVSDIETPWLAVFDGRRYNQPTTRDVSVAKLFEISFEEKE